MPLNTRIALDDIRASVTRGVSTVTSQVSNLNPENITRSIDDARAAATRAATGALGAANSFTAGIDDARAAATRGVANSFTAGIDDARAAATRAATGALGDQTTGTPSPSTIQATNSPPSASTTPSLAGRQNTTFATLSPRPYFRTDPLDNRYDFLTGQKINTIRGNPNVAAPPPAFPNSGNTTGGTGPGGSPGTSAVSVGYGEGQVDPALAQAAGLEGNLTDEQQQDLENTETGTRTIQGIEVPADFPQITLAPGEEFIDYSTDGNGNYNEYRVKRTGTDDEGYEFTETVSIPFE